MGEIEALKRHIQRVWPGIFYFAGAFLVVLLGKNNIYSGSLDFTQHYEIVIQISKNWVWPYLGKPLPFGMEAYPPLAHYLGAIIGLFVGSPVVGMNTASVLSIFGCYLLLATAVSHGRSLLGLAAGIATSTVGLIAGRSQYAVEGFQTYHNFFYAQMVGEFAFLAAAFWLTQTGLAWRFKLALTAAATLVLGWLYMMTAIEVALTYIALEGIVLLRRVREARRFEWSWSIPVACGAVVLPIIIVAHPAMRNMVTISKGDGQLPLGIISDFVPQLAVLLLALAAGLGIFTTDGQGRTKGLLFLAAAGCASAAATLAQASLVLLGLGSHYAVKKYGFSDVTLLVFILGAITGFVADKTVRTRSAVTVDIAAATAFATIATLFMPKAPPDRLDRFVDFQQYVRSVWRSRGLPENAIGHTASMAADFGPGLNFLESLTELQLPPATLLAHYNGDPNATEVVTYGFMNDRERSFPDRCIVPRSRWATFVLARVQCVHEWPIALGKTMELSKAPFLPSYFTKGWSGYEGSGVWSLGHQAELRFHLDQPPPVLKLAISGHAFIPAKGSVQHVSLYVGDVLVGSFTFDDKTPAGTITAEIPSALVKNGDLTIAMKLPDATSPAGHKINPDARQLAFFVEKLSIGGSQNLAPGYNQDFSQMADKPDFFTTGWSGKELSGFWNEGKTATISLHVAKAMAGVRIALAANAFIPRPGYVQHVLLAADGHEVARWTFDARSPSGERVADIPPSLIHDGYLKLDVSFPDATSPAEQKLSGDSRKLAVFVRGFSVDDLATASQRMDSVDLSKVGNLPDLFSSGWTGKEAIGVWSDARRATMSLHAGGNPSAVTLTLDADPFLPHPGYVQHVVVRASGERIGEWIFDDGSSAGPKTLSIPGRFVKPNGKLQLAFDLPDAVSPRSQNLSGDERILAIFVKRISLQKAEAAISP
jgi:hypothetical protein